MEAEEQLDNENDDNSDDENGNASELDGFDKANQVGGRESSFNNVSDYVMVFYPSLMKYIQEKRKVD
jgi:hypothetical protein